MKQFANILTAARILLSVVLLFLSPLSTAFFFVYALCGFTDMIDGTVARKLGIADRFGALLDSVADMVFVAVSSLCLLPMLYPLIPSWWFYPALAVLAVKVLSLMAGFLRFRKPCFLHTRLNKLTGGALFFLPFFYSLRFFPVLFGISCAIAMIAAVDEFRKMLSINVYDADNR